MARDPARVLPETLQGFWNHKYFIDRLRSKLNTYDPNGNAASFSSVFIRNPVFLVPSPGRYAACQGTEGELPADKPDEPDFRTRQDWTGRLLPDPVASSSALWSPICFPAVTISFSLETPTAPQAMDGPG